ncbi:MAG TPA: hypothetical protein VGP21_07370, partial [Opitutaceae bacterium]|nr:hypothetical protein [Opitutaceae bacterium]
GNGVDDKPDEIFGPLLDGIGHAISPFYPRPVLQGGIQHRACIGESRAERNIGHGERPGLIGRAAWQGTSGSRQPAARHGAQKARDTWLSRDGRC